MIDFEKELEKFKPINEIDNIEDALKNDELEDIMDLLRSINNNR